MKNAYRIVVEKLEEKKTTWKTGVNERIILK
jgi:hypothetical protein